MIREINDIRMVTSSYCLYFEVELDRSLEVLFSLKTCSVHMSPEGQIKYHGFSFFLKKKKNLSLSFYTIKYRPFMLSVY